MTLVSLIRCLTVAAVFALVWQVFMPLKARAQQQPQAPQCSPVYALPVVEITRLMLDLEGDWWVLLRVVNTGKQTLGYIKRDQFCPVANGKTNPES